MATISPAPSPRVMNLLATSRAKNSDFSAALGVWESVAVQPNNRRVRQKIALLFQTQQPLGDGGYGLEW